jgi:quercetin dioxygenase-like cupin family protein
MRKPMSCVELAGLALALAGAPVVAGAQTKDLDATKADAAHHKVELENDQVRVVRYVIPPHEKTAMHDHPALVNVSLTDVEARATTPDGKTTEVHGKAGTAAWRGPTAHVFENVSDKPIEGILVEPKGRGDPAWKPPARDDMKVDPEHHKIEFENEQVRVERYWYGKGEKGGMHDHPANVQIALTDASARATMGDGKVAEAQTKAGQVRFRPPLSHAIENTGDRFEGILVVLKTPGKAGGK